MSRWAFNCSLLKNVFICLLIIMPSLAVGGVDKIGVYRPNQRVFYLDLDGNYAWDKSGDESFRFGARDDVPIAGDWDADGFDETGVFRPQHGVFYLDLDGDNIWNASIDRRFRFGAPHDVPIVGDWNGDGVDDVGTYRPQQGVFYLDHDGDNIWNASTDRSIRFGAINDVPVIGDWNGDAVDEIGVFRLGIFYLDFNGNEVWDGPAEDRVFRFGTTNDAPVTGDWNGDAIDEIGIYRSSEKSFYLDTDGNQAWSESLDSRFRFGTSNDVPIAGNWISTPNSENAPPVITLLGVNPITIELGHSYIDPGATAVDDVDGDLTTSVVVDDTGVNTASVGTYSVTYTVSDSSGNPAQATRSVEVIDLLALPVGWVSQDIGDVDLTGNAGYSGMVFTVQGAGEDIWNNADGFHFVYQPLTGDGEISARITGIDNVHSYTKAGVMIRESLTSDASYSMVNLTPTNGIYNTRRATRGGLSDSKRGNQHATAPYWVKLVRKGDVFSAYESPDGLGWTLVDNQTISMGLMVYIGLAVTSHDATMLAAAKFDHVIVEEAEDYGSVPVVQADYHVATNGKDSNPGTQAMPFASIGKADSVAQPGDLIYVRGGTYSPSSDIVIRHSGTSGNMIRLFAYPGETPIFDGANLPYARSLIRLSGASYWHIKGLEIKNAADAGIVLANSAQHNTLEYLNVHHNGRIEDGKNAGGNGIMLTSGSANNLILNCDSHHNRDLTLGNADGFYNGSQGTGNVFRDNRAWRNSDDGFDNWNGGAAIFQGNWAWENGYDDDLNELGDGNGFKLGGNHDGKSSGGHIVRNNLAWRNRKQGFDENSALRPLTLFNNTAWNNTVRNFGFWERENIFRNNVSYMGRVSISGSDQNNSWSLPVTLTNADFVTLDDSVARGPRKADGLLPDNGFLNLSPKSDLIDSGVDIGLSFSGKAPDLGAFEFVE